MCGVGGKADRRPIDPPPIVQLRVVDPLQRTNSMGRTIQRPNSPTSPSTTTTMAGSPTPSARDSRDTPATDGTASSGGAGSGGSTMNVDRDGNSATPTPSTATASTVGSYAQSYLQNPYYFMFACLAKPDDDAELHWLKVMERRSILQCCF
ncbi:hypothetical protein GYMLUDRAFT_935204 [Collybiopsis luxurians FD-317 M1]|nr:hypothetical protein GYMLUDRAFT_935204 [Collybiopsis luxurians FD-317 M1]